MKRLTACPARTKTTAKNEGRRFVPAAFFLVRERLVKKFKKVRKRACVASNPELEVAASDGATRSGTILKMGH
jgi:hypothetical protein